MATWAALQHWPFLVRLEDGYPLPTGRIEDQLGWGDTADKVCGMKRAIAVIVNGDSYHLRDFSDAVVSYVLPCCAEDRTLQKLLLLYLEVISTGVDIYGRVPLDKALICTHLRNYLEDTNDHIRRDTLRFLSRVGDVDLIEPLVASVLANLDHPHAVVRRDAFSAVYAFCRLRKRDGGKLLPCAPTIVERALGVEQDAAAMRNAFLTLFIYAQRRASAYVLANADRVVSEWPDLLQMLVVLIARRHRFDTRHTDIVMSLISDPTTSNAVVFECADALVWISSGATTAVRVAANAYCKLLSKSSLSMTKRLVVRDRLHQLCISHADAMLGVDLPAPPHIGCLDTKRTMPNTET